MKGRFHELQPNVCIFIYLVFSWTSFANIYFIRNTVKLTATTALDCNGKFVFVQKMKRTGPNAPNLLHRAYISVCLTFPRFHVIVCKVETLRVFVKQRGLPLRRKGAVSLCLPSCLTPADDLSSSQFHWLSICCCVRFLRRPPDFQLHSPSNFFFSTGFC